MRRALPLLSLLLVVSLAPAAVATAPAAADAAPSCPQTFAEPLPDAQPAADAPEWDGREPVEASCSRCPAEEVLCSNDSQCAAACPCGGRCVLPRLQICVYELQIGGDLIPIQPHCECNIF